MLERRTVLITDLDNTLFDWVHLWHECFTALMAEVVAISGVPFETLKPEIRSAHQRHGTSEYSFLLDELPSLRKILGNRKSIDVFAVAIDAYRAKRRDKLRLYATVAETLLKIKGSGTTIVGYTESMAFYSNYRIRRLGLDGVFDHIFSPADHDTPDGISLDDVRKYPAQHYQFRYTKHSHTPKGSLKPNAEILLSIISSLRASRLDCVYLGDSLQKDIAMARDAGVMDIFAQYGRAQDTAAYVLLREVTHWSDEDVEREKKISERDVKPGIRLEKEFSEILQHVSFGDRNGR